MYNQSERNNIINILDRLLDNQNGVKEKRTECINIGIWNVTSLNGNDIEVAHEMECHNVKIVGISEIKKALTGKSINDQCKLYYSGVQQGQRLKEGVGIVIRK